MISDQAGKLGLIEDLPGHRLGNEAWTTADNIRFNDGYAEKSLGHSNFLTCSVAPHYLQPLQETSVFYWIYYGLGSIYITDGVNDFLAGSGYSATLSNRWNGDIFGGIPVATNGVDLPQMLYPVGPTNSFSDLTNWPTDYRCKSIKSFGGYWIALNVIKNGAENPYLVKWSHQTDAGLYPVSWDAANPIYDAGEKTLGESGGEIVDGGTLGDSFIVYRENSTYAMRIIGGRFIFSFERIFDEQGIFSPRCFVPFKGGHCVLTDDDLVIHTGNKGSSVSIADSRTRDTLFNTLGLATNPDRTFLAHNNKKSEIWVCYPETTAEYCVKALIWNYEHNTFSHRDLPGVMDIDFNVVQTVSGSTWAEDAGTWASDSTLWGDRAYDPSKRDMIAADTLNSKLLKLDDTNQFGGVSFTATLTRTDLTLDNDLGSRHRAITLYPLMTGDAVSVRMGSQEVPGGTVTWKANQTFTPGTDYKLDFIVDGRLLAVEFSSTGAVDWRVHAYDIKARTAGK